MFFDEVTHISSTSFSDLSLSGVTHNSPTAFSVLVDSGSFLSEEGNSLSYVLKSWLRGDIVKEGISLTSILYDDDFRKFLLLNFYPLLTS